MAVGQKPVVPCFSTPKHEQIRQPDMVNQYQGLVLLTHSQNTARTMGMPILPAAPSNTRTCTQGHHDVQVPLTLT